MNHWAIRINPEAQRTFLISSGDINRDASGLQIQHLPKRRSLLKERLFETDSNPPQLHQFRIRATAGPGITFGKIKDQIAGRFDPHICSKVAVTNRHGAVVVLAGRVPDDVIHIRGLTFTRHQSGHGIKANEGG